jgi:hypothetical protein
VPACLELAAQGRGAGVLPVPDAAVGVLGRGRGGAAEDAWRVRVGSERAVDALEGLELLHHPFAPQRVLALAVAGDAGGGVGDVDGGELEGSVGVVDDRREQAFGPGEAPGGGVDRGEDPAAGDEQAVGAERSWLGEAVAAGELEGVDHVEARALAGGAPGGDGFAADLLQGYEVGGEFGEPGGEDRGGGDRRR